MGECDSSTVWIPRGLAVERLGVDMDWKPVGLPLLWGGISWMMLTLGFLEKAGFGTTPRRWLMFAGAPLTLASYPQTALH